MGVRVSKQKGKRNETQASDPMLESKKPSSSAQISVVVEHLTNKNSDTALVVRVFCIRGIGSLASFGPKVVNDNAENILRVILAGLEDSAEGNINSAPVEAMKSLSKILPVIDRDRVQDALISFAMRLRPLFESDNPMVRSMAFSLFGQSAAMAEAEPVRAAFLQEIHNVLVILLLHLNDEHADVSSSTRAVFKQLLPLLKSDGLNNAFSYPEGIPYGRLVRLICGALGHDYPDKLPMFLNLVVGYFRSESAAMRANAALLAGNLLAQGAAANLKEMSSIHVSPALVTLLSDKESTVRQRAAEALGTMY